MDRRAAGAHLTARERQVARLIGRGLTNRAIGLELGISERTADAHIQNILNKLGASNRAQIASWSAQEPAQEPVAPQLIRPALMRPPSPLPPAAEIPVLTSIPGRSTRPIRGLALVSALVLVGIVVPSDQSAGSLASQGPGTVERGDLVFNAHFPTDGSEFSQRYVIGDADASAVRFVNGVAEYSIVKLGGNTGNSLALAGLPAYYVEFELSVAPRSNLTFWLNLTSGNSTDIGEHVIDIETQIESMQMAYFTNSNGVLQPLGPEVFINGLQSGRKFTVSALVKPPWYTVFLDGARVINLIHAPNEPLQSVSLSIFGTGTGTVRMNAIRVYLVS